MNEQYLDEKQRGILEQARKAQTLRAYRDECVRACICPECGLELKFQRPTGAGYKEYTCGCGFEKRIYNRK